MYAVYLLVAAHLANARVPNELLPRACAANNCNRAITGTSGGSATLAAHLADCSSYFSATVYPSPMCVFNAPSLNFADTLKYCRRNLHLHPEYRSNFHPSGSICSKSCCYRHCKRYPWLCRDSLQRGCRSSLCLGVLMWWCETRDKNSPRFSNPPSSPPIQRPNFPMLTLTDLHNHRRHPFNN